MQVNQHVKGQFDSAYEYPYTNADFKAIAAMVHAHAGICMPEGKAMLIYSRLTKLVRDRQLQTFAAYVELISHDAVERARAIEALTTNHTKFFRENHHFEHFEHELRDVLIRRLTSGGKLRMWSSACSSGEEVYSLAMTLLGTDRNAARKILESNVALLATDLADHVLRSGEAGIYPANVLEEIPSHLAKAWTTPHPKGILVNDPVRQMVRFRKLNLLNAWPIKGQFDVIFCRNVMIYFDEPTKELLLKRLGDQLVPGGYLYIGHSERLIGPANDCFTPVGQTIYRKDK